jgi:hypothetical protein
MVRLLALYNPPEDPADMASAQAALGSPIGADASADVAKFATTGAATLLYEVAEA